MIRPVVLTVAALALAGCSVKVDSPLLAEAPKMAEPKFEPIATAGQFLDVVAGQPITYENGAVLVAEPDGTLGGNVDGEAPGGRWSFSAGQFCRVMEVGGVTYPELCNVVEVGEGLIRFLNADGTLASEAKLG